MKLKVDLTLLKQLVAELETTMATADLMPVDSTTSNNDYVIEMSKAIGLASGAALEATMLVSDIQLIIKKAASPSPSKEDGLKGLLDMLKGGKIDGTN
jgi:predicted house-cleaning NTP pyrophosphatase (Maf/HAM1 superfamily)